MMQSLQLNPKMNIQRMIPITHEFELWDQPPISQKAKNNRGILRTEIQLKLITPEFLNQEYYNNGCLLLDQTKLTYI